MVAETHKGNVVKVRVDSDRCQGHTLCSMIAPESFELDDIEGHASAVTEDVAPDQEDAVREAAHSCPEQAILIRDDR
jgi:ferredoxin